MKILLGTSVLIPALLMGASPSASPFPTGSSTPVSMNASASASASATPAEEDRSLSPTAYHAFFHNYDVVDEAELKEVQDAVERITAGIHGPQKLVLTLEIANYWRRAGSMQIDESITFDSSRHMVPSMFYEMNRFCERITISGKNIIDVGVAFYKWLPATFWKCLDLSGCPKLSALTRDKISAAWVDAGKDLRLLFFSPVAFTATPSFASSASTAVAAPKITKLTAIKNKNAKDPKA